MPWTGHYLGLKVDYPMSTILNTWPGCIQPDGLICVVLVKLLAGGDGYKDR